MTSQARFEGTMADINHEFKGMMMSQENKLPEWITTREAAEIMDVVPSNVRYLCANGSIECQKFGRNWMVSREAAESYIKSNRYPSYRDDE